MGRAGFEPTKPKQLSYSQSHLATLESPQTFLKEPPEGFEPTTPRLQITCSGQLSYTGNTIFQSEKTSALRGANIRHFFVLQNKKKIF